jgi:hypothetical protein
MPHHVASMPHHVLSISHHVDVIDITWTSSRITST